MGTESTRRKGPDPLCGTTLGGCEIQERIGRGGMGTVYRARHLELNRTVAVKILSPFLASDDAVVARFTREAHAASRVDHANVVQILATGEEKGFYFTIMEFVEGENLSQILKREERLSLGRAVHIAREVARGLSALHLRGVIHRDVKPSNVLIGRDGSVKVTDFGVARDIHDLQRLTMTGDLLGTIGFAAPEQLKRSTVDARADLYSLGATLHYMLTGVRPSADPTASPSPLGEDVPAGLRDLVHRLLARDPDGRPGDAGSVASQLSSFARSTTSSSRSLRARSLRLAFTLGGVSLVFGAGVQAAGSHGPDFHARPWIPVLPSPGSLFPSLGLFGAGVLLAVISLIRGRERIGLGLRSLLGFSFLAGSLVVAYMAGSSMATLTLRDAARSLVSCAPGPLFPTSFGLAALGLFVGMRRSRPSLRWAFGTTLVLIALGAAATASSAGSIRQAVSDLRNAMSRSAWAWLSFVLAASGVVLASRHRGSLWRVLLAPLAVFVSVGMIYWSSQGTGSPPLEDALSGPAGAVALAILLGFAARIVLDLRPGPTGNGLAGGNRSDPTTVSSATPTPSL